MGAFVRQEAIGLFVQPHTHIHTHAHTYTHAHTHTHTHAHTRTHTHTHTYTNTYTHTRTHAFGLRVLLPFEHDIGANNPLHTAIREYGRSA